MNPSAIAIKRIINDIKDLTRDPLDKEGIYHHYDDVNVMNVKIMIIGPEDTPYENGFYFFDFTFPNDYPFNPPMVKYETRDGNIRFNPNLYTCGKVCLSLINTWEGPKWTSCQTLRSILISLRGLVLGVKYPIQNEPGYESCKDNKATDYNNIIHYQNYRIALVKMLKNPAVGFECFLDIMKEYVQMKYPWYFKKITELTKFDGKTTNSIYGMTVQYNYEKVLSDLHTILKMKPKESNKEEFEEKIEKNPNEPNESPNEYYLGYQKRSQNDRNMYIVEEKVKNMKKLKYWNKIEEVIASTTQVKTIEDTTQVKTIEDTTQVKTIEDTTEVKKAEKKKKKYNIHTLSDSVKQVINQTPVIQTQVNVNTNDSESKEEKEKGKRKAPTKSAKNLELGTTMISENDGKTYEVVQAGSVEKQFKRWVLSKKPLNTKFVETKVEVKNVEDTSNKVVEETKLESDEVSSISSSEGNEKEKGKRKAPSKSAKNLDVGSEMFSENDGKTYLVKMAGSGEKQFKRWVLKK